ncbi:hypothetical protein PFLG_02943 [Plasmodium falciparum RAJ116]|uniref:Uncharacterized protein n=1 Tax=Plasmodium falciparum RAJ116 TaxID=580058 RepID=A0A0L0D0X7_PLAFA|nr:hypothetical protein PFLG_02943 [Plasmodium falciparum RAJ116]
MVRNEECIYDININNRYLPILDKLINGNEKIIIFLALTKLQTPDKIKNGPFVGNILNSLNKNITSNDLGLKKSRGQHLDVEKEERAQIFEVTYGKFQMTNKDKVNGRVRTKI